VIACEFGGTDRRTLFVISSESIDFEERRVNGPDPTKRANIIFGSAWSRLPMRSVKAVAGS
jgi:hypothetical protein